jgi:membrane-associated phospholipid phosphatase
LTPAFQSYISGHSTFSSASAKVLQLFTGSDTFGYSTVIRANFGRVEPGIPAVPTPKSFATFSEAAQEAGLSRLYGGIHFFDDNDVGQMLGALIGQQAWDKAQTYFNGTAP